MSSEEDLKKFEDLVEKNRTMLKSSRRLLTELRKLDPLAQDGKPKTSRKAGAKEEPTA